MKGGSYGNNDDILQRCHYRHRTYIGIPRHSTFNRLEKEMTINSRQKGKRGELEIAHIMQEHGFDAKRSQQYCGINGDADVVGVPYLHLEIKRVQALNLDKAMEQSTGDAKEDEIPVVMHRKDRKPWLVTCNLDDFMRFYKAWLKEWEE